MSHRPDHCLSSLTLDSAGISSSTCPARPSMNSNDPRIEYDVNGSTLAPKTSSPRSVWLMYTCSVPDTMTVDRNGLTGSVTAACKGNVWIGSLTPAMSQISVDQPAVALSTTRVAMSPRVVRTPRTRPSATSIPMTSVFWWMCAPRASAPRAYPQTTASCRMMPPGGCQRAPTTGYRACMLTSINGASRFTSAGSTTSESTPCALF